MLLVPLAPLAPEALLSFAEVQALVASEPSASASSTKAAERMRDAVMVSLLMSAWPVRASRGPDRPRAICSAAMSDLTRAGCDLFHVRHRRALSFSAIRTRTARTWPKNALFVGRFVTQRYS